MAGARGLRFEFASRGDRVPGRVILPPAGGVRPPLILLQHGAGGSKEAEYLDVAAAPWVARGAALASIDFPLHGERANPKLARFLGSGAQTPGDDALRVEYRLLRSPAARCARVLRASIETEGIRCSRCPTDRAQLLPARTCPLVSSFPCRRMHSRGREGSERRARVSATKASYRP